MFCLFIVTGKWGEWSNVTVCDTRTGFKQRARHCDPIAGVTNCPKGHPYGQIECRG